MHLGISKESLVSVDVSDIFNFFLLGGGEGESKAPGGWGTILS